MSKIVLIFLLALACVAQVGSFSSISTYSGYLFTTFEADMDFFGISPPPQPNGPGELRIFQSPDASFFVRPAILPTYNCAAFLRDPSIMKSAVSGVGLYYMVHSVAGFTGTACTPNLNQIGWSSSVDGLTWANATLIDFSSAIPSVQVVGAPEWFIDPNASGLSAIHIFFDASTSTSLATANIYEIHPTTTDFSTWSVPLAITITSESNNVIDAFLVYRADTALYYIWFKALSCSCLNYASSSTLLGTYTDVETDSDWMGIGGSNTEGPCIRQIVAGSPGTWRLFFDYNATATSGNVYYADSTNGWATFSKAHSLICPNECKHGTVLPFP